MIEVSHQEILSKENFAGRTSVAREGYKKKKKKAKASVLEESGVCSNSSLRSSYPSQSQRGAEKGDFLHACVASPSECPCSTPTPRAQDQLACVVRFLRPGLAVDTCPLLPGANERDEQDLPLPLSLAKGT